ncbi:hypothetical protein AB4Z39_32150 [Mycobacterium adipatum]|uniref:hypothetical protein n=1 Tax=Mycobacterium adipatum TaxID=1682113 RepID=UPI0034E05D75
MTETPETRTEPTAVTTDRRESSAVRRDRPNRLNRIAALVGIVAGVVFIIAAIFFSGFVLGAHSGGDFGRDHRGDEFGMMNRDGRQPMGPGGMMGPGQMGPGQMGPGQMGPGQMGPGQMGPGQMGPGQMGPGQMGPGQMTPGQQQSPTTTTAVPSSPRP